MIGIDAVDIERLRRLLSRSPRAESRLFTEAERSYCKGHSDPVLHLAGTLATKEAVIKAASLGPLVSWSRRIEVQRGNFGAPAVKIDGDDAPKIEVSISHDGGLAVAIAVVRDRGSDLQVKRSGPRPNLRLMRYLAAGLAQYR